MMLKLMMAVFMSSAASANCPCDIPEYRELVQQTEERVLERGAFHAPYDFFQPNREYGCALMVFDITANGDVSNIRTVVSKPTRAIATRAKQSLVEYKFIKSSTESFEKGALLFEAKLKNDQ